MKAAVHVGQYQWDTSILYKRVYSACWLKLTQKFNQIMENCDIQIWTNEQIL